MIAAQPKRSGCEGLQAGIHLLLVQIRPRIIKRAANACADCRQTLAVFEPSQKIWIQVWFSTAAAAGDSTLLARPNLLEYVGFRA